MEAVLNVVVPAAVAIIVSVVTLYANRGKNKADEASAYSGVWAAQVESLRREVKDLRERTEELENKIILRDETIETLKAERDSYRGKYEDAVIKIDNLEARIIALEKTSNERDGLIAENKELRGRLRDALGKGGLM